MNKTKYDKKAKHLPTGKTVWVYKHISGNWIDSSDHKTEYPKKDIKLL